MGLLLSERVCFFSQHLGSVHPVSFESHNSDYTVNSVTSYCQVWVYFNEPRLQWLSSFQSLCRFLLVCWVYLMPLGLPWASY